MLNYICLAALCVCVLSAPLDKITTTTTTTSTTPKIETKIQTIDNLTLITHPAGTLNQHALTKRQYDHHRVAVLVGHDHYVSGAAFHAPILVSDDHADHVGATHASISSDQGKDRSTAAQPSITNDRHERSKDETVRTTTNSQEKDASTTVAVTSSTTPKSAEAKKSSEATQSHPGAHLNAASTTPATISTTSTPVPTTTHKNHKRHTPVEAHKTTLMKNDESVKLASNPTIASPLILTDHSKQSTERPKSTVNDATHPKATIKNTSTTAQPSSTKTDKSLHKQKRDASTVETNKPQTTSESPRKEAVKTTPKSVATKSIPSAESVSKNVNDDEHAHHKRDTEKKLTAISNKDIKNVATSNSPKLPISDNPTATVETKKAAEHIPDSEQKRDTPTKVTNVKSDITSMDTKSTETKYSAKIPVKITEHSHGQNQGHDQHKREATEEKKESSSPVLSNPTIASPVQLFQSASKTESTPTTESVVSAASTKKPDSDSQNKPHKRETTKDAKDTVAKPEALVNLSNPTIDSLLKSNAPPKEFHTSHKIPDHIETARLHEDSKFQTSHQIPVHAAPVVVGVTPKKTEAILDNTTKTESAPKKEDTKDTKKPIGSRHRRDTSTTPKPSDTNKPDQLVRVPLVKTKTVEVQPPKQQNGHAAHSDVARTKRESKNVAASGKSSSETPAAVVEEHHQTLVFPVPVDQIVKHSNAAPEIHHHSDSVHLAETVTTNKDTSKEHHTDGSHKLDKKHVVNHQSHSSTTETPFDAAAHPLRDAAVNFKPVA